MIQNKLMNFFVQSRFSGISPSLEVGGAMREVVVLPEAEMGAKMCLLAT